MKSLNKNKNATNVSIAGRGRGRPPVNYENASFVTKRRKRNILNSATTDEEIYMISETKMRLDDNVMGAHLMKRIVDRDDATIIFESINKEESPRQMSAELALSLIIEGNLTKHSYNFIRKIAIEHGHDLYASYEKVQEAKKSTYLDEISVTESKCEVPLQSLLKHTANRLIKHLNITFDENKNTGLTLTCKYGFDGTNVNPYKQKFFDKENKYDSLLCTSLVPLLLMDKSTNKIYWKNEQPSSVRFCRPIKIEFTKETLKKILDEEAFLKSQIDRLKKEHISGCSIEFEMLLTMIDGKVCNAINNSSSQICFICKSSISNMNKIEEMSRKIADPATLKYGFSILHAYIRFMELVLHVSYRMEIKEWRVNKNKAMIVADRKKKIQSELRNELGINVDEPTHGSGNTNDENMARSFFNNIETVSRVTGFDKHLLDRFKVILAVINSSYMINVTAFQDYCYKTAELYIQLYDWYYMPPSMHIIFMHGYQILENFFIPIGMISEEVQEANHKIIKRFRELYSRKMSREMPNTDMFHRLLQNSDPVISSSRNLINKHHQALNEEMKKLLLYNNSEIYREQDVSIDSNFNCS